MYYRQRTPIAFILVALVSACVTLLSTGCAPDSIAPSLEVEAIGSEAPSQSENVQSENVPLENATSNSATSGTAMPKMAMPDPSKIVFKDEITSNVEVPEGLDGLVFLDTTGKRVALEDYLGKQNVVLVFTEGFGGGMLCPFCKTQTSRLVANYDKFQSLDSEVLVVYPGTRDHLDEFISAAKKSDKKQVDRVPFPLVLDEDLSAVGYFNIASNLAHPSTFVIDKSGNVRLAYVGADMSADRPSVAALLSVLEDANNL